MKYLRNIIFSLSILLVAPSFVHSQEADIQKGRVINSSEVSCGDITENDEFNCIQYEVELETGETVKTSPTWINNPEDIFKDGRKVYISQNEIFEGEDPVWNIESYSMENYLLILFLVFVGLIVLVTGKGGFRATVGLASSFAIIYFFAIPSIVSGANIWLVSSVTILALLIAATFLTYGLNIKSLISFISTLFGVILIAILGSITIKILGISGTGEESSAMLFEATLGTIKLSHIFLLSILIGALGVLDDVTVGQTSSMIEIFQTDKSLKANELFKKSMNIGSDHIASMVNTLFIAYAGSSFSLVMLLSANSPSFRVLINTGFVVEELVRTLVASIGLVLVVPLTSFIASRIIVGVLKK